MKIRHLTQNDRQQIAKYTVFRMIKVGMLVRPKHCSSCGKKCKPHAHHPDYRKPRRVVWLCASCHRKETARIGITPGSGSSSNLRTIQVDKQTWKWLMELKKNVDTFLSIRTIIHNWAKAAVARMKKK